MGGELRFGRFQVGQHGLAHDGAEQVLLGREVEVDRALADAGGRGDILQLGRGVAALGERGERGGDDFTGSGVLAAGAEGHRCYLLTVQSVFKEPDDPLVDLQREKHGT